MDSKSVAYLVALLMFIVATVYTVGAVLVFKEYNIPTYTIGWFMINLIPIGLYVGCVGILLKTAQRS